MKFLLRTTGGRYIWSGETYGSLSAWYIDFDDGLDRSFNRDDRYSYGHRGFAVRSRR